MARKSSNSPRKGPAQKKQRRTSGRRKSPRKKTVKKAQSGRWRKRILVLVILFGLIFMVYLWLLDSQVTTKFTGRRWAIPARVYARPLELYPGASVTSGQLAAELKRLGYQPVSYPKRTASWSRNGNRFLIRTRPFRFWDGDTPSRLLEVRYEGAGIVSMMADNQPVAVARLEAPEIGSIYPAHHEDRVLVSRRQLPDLLVKGLIAVEDRAFYDHYGVDPKGILRALWNNLRAGGVVQGGSTLTQQLVKNFYLNRKRSLWRKLNEALMALLLDYHYSKDNILEAYANEIYLGQDGERAVHGFGLASHFYFNRPLGELDLPRIALLVGMVKGPSLYDPRRHPKRAKKRRNLVLDLMRDQGVISTRLAERAKAKGLGVTSKKGQWQRRFPGFLDLVRRQLHRDYKEEDLTSEGLQIFTTLDPWMQEQASQVVTRKISQLERSRSLPAGKLQVAAIVADPQSGEVQVLIGDRDPKYAGFNRALDAVRPIGSLVKPVIYMTALEQPERYTLISRIEDKKVALKLANGKQWRPENYDHTEHGKVLLHQALAHSYNLATVNLGLQLGLEQVAATLRRLGVNRPIEQVPAMLLGAVALSPMEVLQLYQVFAAGGYYSPLRAIREVMTSKGEPLQRYPLTVHEAVDAAPVYLLNRNLQEVVRQGTGRGLSTRIPADYNLAGKTGTTNDLRDSWFAGFSGDHVAVVWVGRDDNQSAGLTGSSGALRVWGDMMQEIGVMPLGLIKPEGVETLWIDPESGLKADQGCPQARQYPFTVGSAPTVEHSCVGQSQGVLNKIFRSFFE